MSDLLTDHTIPYCYLCSKPAVLVIAQWNSAQFHPIPSYNSAYCIVAFRHFMSCNFVLLTIVTSCVLSTPFIPGLFCNVYFWPIPSCNISYYHVVIHYFIFRPDMIHCLPSYSIAYFHVVIHHVNFRPNLIHRLSSILFHIV